MNKLGLVFLIIFIIEIVGIIAIGSIIGVFATIMWMIISAFIGIKTIKCSPHYSVFHTNKNSISSLFNQGFKSPLTQLNLIIIGILLILPGFFSDFLGLLFLMIHFMKNVFFKPTTNQQQKQNKTSKGVYDLEQGKDYTNID